MKRFVLAVAAASMLAVGMVRLSASGDYNDNPPYCHSHDAWDPLWWIYRCWLPDPPGEPM